MFAALLCPELDELLVEARTLEEGRWVLGLLASPLLRDVELVYDPEDMVEGPVDGIWLLDASVVGINGLRPDVKREVTRLSWETYFGPRVRSLDPRPKSMIVIGKAVAEAAFGSESRTGEWAGIPYEVVNQPQGDRTREQSEKTLSTLFRLCPEGKQGIGPKSSKSRS